MQDPSFAGKAMNYLGKLCTEIPTRRVGSQGNRMATEFVAEKFRSFGFDVQCPEFDCMDWVQHGAEFVVGGEKFEVQVSPYSLGGQVEAPLVVIDSAADLAEQDFKDKVLLMYGVIAKEQLMPKNFTFYNPEHHQEIYRLLESGRPKAIIAATGKNPEMAGAVYPFPLFEDGDFDIPSVYIKDVEVERLLPHRGGNVMLDIKAERIPATGCNVVARKGTNRVPRVVLFAHIDAKEGTPGAIDNASGVAALLMLGELLQQYQGDLGVEIVTLNGEDYYSAPGEMDFVKRNEGKFSEILLGINLDGAGYIRGFTAFSLYDCPEKIAEVVTRVFANYPDMQVGQPWYQSDHGLFLMHQRPALAITSMEFTDIWNEIAHTSRDTLEIINCARLVNVAYALYDLLWKLNQLVSTS